MLGTAGPNLAPLVWTHLALSGGRLDLEMRVAGPLPVRLGHASASGGEVVEDRCASRHLAPGEACRVGIHLAGTPGTPVLDRLGGAVGTFPLFPASADPRSEGSPPGDTAPASAPPLPPQDPASAVPLTGGPLGLVIPAKPGAPSPPLPLPDGAVRH